MFEANQSVIIHIYKRIDMKHFFINTLVLSSFFNSLAQVDVSSLSPITTDASIVIAQNDDANFYVTAGATKGQYITTLSPGSSTGLVISMGDIEASPNTNFDTITVQVYPFIRNVSTTEAGSMSLESMKSSFYGESSIAEGFGSNVFFSNVKLVENTIDTILITNTSANVSITVDVMVIRTSYCGALCEVISNIQGDLFGEGNVLITNPLRGETLELFNIPSDVSAIALELLSLQGDVLLSKNITHDDSSLDISTLNAGIYIIRDTNTGSTKKIVVE